MLKKIDYGQTEARNESDCQKLDEKMNELISIIITKDYEDLQRILLDIKNVDFKNITSQDILAYKFMAKIKFAYAQHKEYPEMIDLVQQIKSQLEDRFRKGIRDSSKWRQVYQEQQ